MAGRNPFDRKAGGFIERDRSQDGIDRRGFLKCMAWAGTGTLCAIEGGVLKSYALGPEMNSGRKLDQAAGLSFVHISDSHMGFNKPANPDVVATLQAAVAPPDHAEGGRPCDLSHRMFDSLPGTRAWQS